MTTREKYLEMGHVHVGKDEEVNRQRAREIDKIMNEHSAAWVSMWRMGEDHDHQGEKADARPNLRRN